MPFNGPSTEDIHQQRILLSCATVFRKRSGLHEFSEAPQYFRELTESMPCLVAVVIRSRRAPTRYYTCSPVDPWGKIICTIKSVTVILYHRRCIYALKCQKSWGTCLVWCRTPSSSTKCNIRRDIYSTSGLKTSGEMLSRTL